MGDCATLETAFSHFVPSLAGSLISTTLIGICLFVVDFRMALAAVWVLPIAFAITFFSVRIQEYFNRKSVEANVALEGSVQECIESLQDLKANNAEKSYLKGLYKKIDDVEKWHIITELGTALFVVYSTLILKFGIATVALVGSVLLIRGEIDIRDMLCSNGTLLLVKSKREIDHIFGELYSVDKRIQSPYFWIKTIELLLFLSLLDGSALQKPQHFSEDISKRTQKVYQYIIENPFDIKTIADLSQEFGIAESSLKRCFKSIAGKSIGLKLRLL